MRFLPLFFLFSILLGTLSFANTLEDAFEVKSISNGQATLSGQVKSLKPGDMLYFARTPFQFKILSVSKTGVVVELPKETDVAVGNNMVRYATDPIKKAIETEHALKSALSE